MSMKDIEKKLKKYEKLFDKINIKDPDKLIKVYDAQKKEMERFEKIFTIQLSCHHHAFFSAHGPRLYGKTSGSN